MQQSTRILLSLVAGLAAGIALGRLAPGAVATSVAVAQPIGTAWLNGLQMTIVPLVVALLVTGIAETTAAARAGRFAARAIVLYTILMLLSAAVAAIAMPLLLDAVPIPAASAAALRAALTDAGPAAAVPPLGDFIAGVVPANVVQAAASGAFLSLIVFALVFAFALGRIEEDGRQLLIRFFVAVRDAMLVVVDWVLWLAPIGVFALALVVGAKAGAGAFGALVHYILTVSAMGWLMMAGAYLLIVVTTRVSLARFARASLPSQAVALSTQSSLATLPAMLEGTQALGVSATSAGIALPLAVAMLRATGPAMNLAVAIYVARWYGVAIPPAAMIAGVVVATLTSLGSVSLPGQVSYISAIAPLATTIGAPVAPLGLLVAVEMLPDLTRTLGNVTMDLAATVFLGRGDMLDPAPDPRGPAADR